MSDDHFSGCSTATAYFPYANTVREGHMVYFENGGHMTIIVMDEEATQDSLTERGMRNVIRTIKDIVSRE